MQPFAVQVTDISVGSPLADDGTGAVVVAGVLLTFVDEGHYAVVALDSGRLVVYPTSRVTIPDVGAIRRKFGL